ncbi:MAG TPA: GDP-mannose 4,6-dehydratase [Solirubrobacteraceae bacterium]|nr:GDP-mannose 4,6-dehydratase [Solirubrobacteraceae bacterium]
MPRRALITGVTGQDGSYLAELLLEKGYEVWGTVRPGSGAPSGVEPIVADLLDPGSLRAAVAHAAPQELYHLAAPSFGPVSWEDPSGVMAAIAGATATILAAALTLRERPRIWVTTSSEMFGDAGESPQDEQSPMRPRTPYGVAKLAAHGLVGALRSRHGLFACSGITYNHESPRRPQQFVTRKITRAAAAISLGLEESVTLGDLGAVRDWCDARDVTRGTWLALQVDEPRDYVLASGVGRTVRDVVALAFAEVDLDPEEHVRVDPALVRPPESDALVGDPSLAARELGWRAEIPFEETIAEMVRADLEELRAEAARAAG